MHLSLPLRHALGKLTKLPPRGQTWPGVGPFIYVGNHLDRYPRGLANYGPEPSLLEGRKPGNDFHNPSGWNMYMAEGIPGFPSHPHKGIETVTIVQSGTIDHADSTKSGARYGRGDVQWVTAGKGVIHSEMFPLLNPPEGNTMDMYQLWVNLAKVDKGADPEFVMFWDEQMPLVTAPGAQVRVIAGKYNDTDPLPPPKASWAARADTDVAMWLVLLEPHATITIPGTNRPDTQRKLYVHEGDVVVAGEPVADGNEILVTANPQAPVELQAGQKAARVLVLQGVDIGEPVAVRGPFVMNTEQENIDGFAEYRKTHFGGFPWDSRQPLWGGLEQKRFAIVRGGERTYPPAK